MKKAKIFGFVALTGLMLASCSEEQTEFTINNVPGKATLSGEVKYSAGTTLTNGNFTYSYQPAAEAEVIVIVSNSQYGNKLEGESVFTTRTDADGKYSIEIPTGSNKSVSATVSVADFVGTTTVVEAKDNVISTVKKSVVYWARENVSVSDHGIHTLNILCADRSVNEIPDSYTSVARIEGVYMCNVETVEPFEAIRDEETNEIIGYRDAVLSYDWAGMAAADLIVEVNYEDGVKATYNCTTDNQGNYMLNVPVPSFPARFSVVIKSMPKVGTFMTYEEIEIEREVKGREVKVRSYVGHRINGYYTQVGNAQASYDFVMSGLVLYRDFRGMIFNACTKDQEIYDYSPIRW